MNFTETMEKAADKDREAGAALMRQKQELEEKIKFFENALRAIQSGTYGGIHAKHIGAIVNLFENELAGAKAEYDGKFSAPQFGNQAPTARPA